MHGKPDVIKTDKVSVELDKLTLSNVRHFSSLQEIKEEFVIFTDSLVYLYGQIGRDLLPHFIHDHAIIPEDRPVAIEFKHKIFDIPKVKINSGRNLWSALYAIKKQYWTDLQDYICGIVPFSLQTGFYGKFHVHDLLIYDYAVMNSKRDILLENIPKLIIQSFLVFSNCGSYRFMSPEGNSVTCSVANFKPISTVVEDSKQIFSI